MNIYLSSRIINTLCAIGCLSKPKVLAQNVAREAANHAVKEVIKLIKGDKKFTDKMIDGDSLFLQGKLEAEVAFSRETWDKITKFVEEMDNE
uniref:Uncharacterized protein n=1 Tax=viral metagenome TaxID=1070528 RepID=A0A6M3JEP9_9ZZZZ